MFYLLLSSVVQTKHCFTITQQQQMEASDNQKEGTVVDGDALDDYESSGQCSCSVGGPAVCDVHWHSAATCLHDTGFIAEEDCLYCKYCGELVHEISRLTEDRHR